MTGDLFGEWLRKLVSSFRAQNRKVVLLNDNSPAIKNLTNNLTFLPPNAISVLQPIDKGVIRGANISDANQETVVADADDPFRSLEEELDNFSRWGRVRGTRFNFMTCSAIVCMFFMYIDQDQFLLPRNGPSNLILDCVAI